MTGWRMRPAALALAVIGIVFAMMTATVSEAESGAIERGINHPVVDEEDRQFREDERIANETSRTVTRAITTSKNDTALEVTMPREYLYVAGDRQDGNNSIVPNDEVVELQGDQSDVPAALRSNDPERDTERSNTLISGSEERVREHAALENKPQGTTAGYIQATSLPIRAESTSDRNLEGQMPTVSKRIELDKVQVDDEGVSNVVDHGDSERMDGSGLEKHEKDSSTMTSIQETIVTEARPIDQKNVQDIRAISFQVPPPLAEPDEQEKYQRGEEVRRKDEARKPNETGKDHSRPTNNLLLAGKSTKAFYEIKPSIKTEMERGYEHQVTSTTQKILQGRKFILPSVDSAFGKFGPYFEDGDQEINITARIGSTVLLDCKIGMLGDKQVTWVQHGKDTFRLLAVGKIPYSVDQRISLNFRYPSNWRLQIQFASPRESGLYECQVATHPPLVKKINVIVTAPELTITDDSGRVVPKERHLKAGSALKLRCEARDVLESLEESVVWKRGDETLTEDVSENRTTEISAGKEVLVIVSTLIVERASPRHAGNYSCVVPGKAKTTIAVHVLNGELPAAVHDGNGASRAFLNLWLIHLTMSYVFSR